MNRVCDTRFLLSSLIESSLLSPLPFFFTTTAKEKPQKTPVPISNAFCLGSDAYHSNE